MAEANQLGSRASGSLVGERDTRARGKTLAVLVAAVIIASMDIFIVNVASAGIQQGIGASGGELQLIISAYSLVYSVLLISCSRLGDRFGRKNIFLIGMAIFTAASLLCGVSTSAEALIVFRVLEGTGAAAMMPQVLPSLHVLYAPEERQWALGLYGAALGIGAVLGQLCGGILVTLDPLGFGWRFVFLVNVPVGIAVIVAGIALIEDSRDQDPKQLDLQGVVVLTATLLSLISPLIAIGRGIWNIWMVGSLCVSVVIGAGFMRLEQIIGRRGGNPLVTAQLFRAPAFTPGVLASCLGQSCLAAFILVYTLHMQFGAGFSALSVGASLGGAAIGYTLASLATGFLVKKWGAYVPVLGSGVVALGYTTIFTLSVAERTALTPFLIFVPLLISAIGRGLSLTPIVNMAFSGLETSMLGMASGVLNTSFQLANLLGVVAIGSLFFAVRDFSPGAFPDRSTNAFLICSAAISAVAILALASVWFQLRSVRVAGARTQN